MTKLDEMKMYKVPVGDDSGDGHEKCETFLVKTNYDVDSMRQAYKDTCKKIGLQMNHNTDYTGIEGVSSWRSWRYLLTEYEQSNIDERAVDILLEHGYGFSECEAFDEDDNLIKDEIYFDTESVFNLFMWFISYSMPEDFIWEEVAEPQVESINGGNWQTGLNHQIGYGVLW